MVGKIEDRLQAQAAELIDRLWTAGGERAAELYGEGKLGHRMEDPRYRRILRLFGKASDRFDRRGGDRRYVRLG
jgi:hypothetical protein